MPEETAVADEVVAEPDVPNPIANLEAAYVTASSLAQAGATDNIRYAAKRATDMLGRLLGNLERHRRVVGAPR